VEADMALIKWNDNLSVNVSEIDNQHQQLIKLINNLDDAMKQGKGKLILGKIVTGLVEYTAFHFSTEEKYFAQFGYEDAENHVREHRGFVEKASDFKMKLDAGSIGLSTDIMNFISDWVKKHIQGSDKKYSAFFNEHGLK
jgi:hemerythrin